MSDHNDTTRMAPGRVSWNELVTTDTKAAADFYGKLFGWKSAPFVPQGMAPPPDAQPYTLFKLNSGDEMGVGGMMQAPQPDMPPMWLPYVVVDDSDAALKKADSLGAKICLPATSSGEVGRVAVIQDPQGATIGLHEFPGE